MTEVDKGIFENAKPWDLPSVDEVQNALDKSTNALNRPRRQWKFEAPEEEKELEPLTAEDIEAIRTSAYQEGLLSGHEEGFEKGHAEGLEKGIEAGKEQGHQEGVETGKAEAKTLIDEQSANLQSLFEQVSQPLAQINDELKSELLILATTLAKAVINVEVSQNEQVIIKAIEAGIKALPIQEKSYHLDLHPDDIAVIHQYYDEQTLKDNNWVITSDEKVERGGCKIITHNNAVDVSIPTRCNNILTQLLLNQGLQDDPRAS
jgi:flagellar assembly protein FliH